MRRSSDRDKELTAVGAGSGIGHGQYSRAVENQGSVNFIFISVSWTVEAGAGRAFSAGFDITRETGDPDLHEIPADIRRDQLKHHIDTFMMIWNLSKPVIAAVNGLALAGACELMQVCDIKIASENAILGEPEIRAGLGPPFLITPFSVSPMKAKELLLTGDTIDAQEALRLGMINRVVPQDQLMNECERTANKICLMAQVGVKMTKRAVNRVMEGMGFLFMCRKPFLSKRREARSSLRDSELTIDILGYLNISSKKHILV